MIASSFGKPVRFGIRTCRSGLPPATHAAVACVRPPSSRRHQSPLGPRQRRQPRANRLRQFVEVHVFLRRRVHRRAHLRQHRRAADDRERAARVDQRAHADGLVEVRAGVKAGRCGRTRNRRRWPALPGRAEHVAGRPAHHRARRLSGSTRGGSWSFHSCGQLPRKKCTSHTFSSTRQAAGTIDSAQELQRSVKRKTPNFSYS